MEKLSKNDLGTIKDRWENPKSMSFNRAKNDMLNLVLEIERLHEIEFEMRKHKTDAERIRFEAIQKFTEFSHEVGMALKKFKLSG